MRSGRDMTIGRRQFVTELALGAFVAASFPSSGEATGQSEDPPNTHNMLVVGERTVFLSHLPMFVGLDKNKTAFRVAPPLSGDRGGRRSPIRARTSPVSTSKIGRRIPTRESTRSARSDS